MKTIKMNSLRTLVNMSLVLILLNFSCAESENKSKANVNNSTESKSKIKAPEMDIQLAILNDNFEIVQQHIEAGTDLNKKDAMSGSTPLITAASFNKIEIAKALVDAGVDLTIKNNDGATALHSASFFCRVEIVKILLNANADKSLRNNFGATARESVMGPFSDIKPIYEMLKQQFEPMGMQIDLNHIEKTRPIVANLLQ